MNTKNKIDPSHIWEIRDERLDATSKSLLVRLAGLQHFDSIFMSNSSLAQDLGVSKRTVIEKMKLLSESGYIAERTKIHETDQTKLTELNRSYIIVMICASAKKDRKRNLSAYYGVCRENQKKVPLQGSSFDRASKPQDDTRIDLLLASIGNDILSL